MFVSSYGAFSENFFCIIQASKEQNARFVRVIWMYIKFSSFHWGFFLPNSRIKINKFCIKTFTEAEKSANPLAKFDYFLRESRKIDINHLQILADNCNGAIKFTRLHKKFEHFRIIEIFFKISSIKENTPFINKDKKTTRLRLSRSNSMRKFIRIRSIKRSGNSIVISLYFFNNWWQFLTYIPANVRKCKPHITHDNISTLVGFIRLHDCIECFSCTKETKYKR